MKIKVVVNLNGILINYKPAQNKITAQIKIKRCWLCGAYFISSKML